MKDIDALTFMTQALLKNGIDYEVTLSSKSKVRLFDRMTNQTIGIAEEDTIEEALFVLFGQVAGKAVSLDLRSSVL